MIQAKELRYLMYVKYLPRGKANNVVIAYKFVARIQTKTPPTQQIREDL
jgi:hypothetical protein